VLTLDVTLSKSLRTKYNSLERVDNKVLRACRKVVHSAVKDLYRSSDIIKDIRRDVSLSKIVGDLKTKFDELK
jgi:hypothetical protein